jgi:hypothetical protein
VLLGSSAVLSHIQAQFVHTSPVSHAATYLLIEARVLVGIRYVNDFTTSHYCSRYALVLRHADVDLSLDSPQLLRYISKSVVLVQMSAVIAHEQPVSKTCLPLCDIILYGVRTTTCCTHAAAAC